LLGEDFTLEGSRQKSQMGMRLGNQQTVQELDTFRKEESEKWAKSEKTLKALEDSLLKKMEEINSKIKSNETITSIQSSLKSQEEANRT